MPKQFARLADVDESTFQPRVRGLAEAGTFAQPAAVAVAARHAARTDLGQVVLILAADRGSHKRTTPWGAGGGPPFDERPESVALLSVQARTGLMGLTVD